MEGLGEEPHLNAELRHAGHHVDGKLAIWEHIYRRPLIFPEQRYPAPIHMRPTAFDWVTDGEILRKNLGRFTEHDVAIEMELLLTEIADVQAARARRDALEQDATARFRWA